MNVLRLFVFRRYPRERLCALPASLPESYARRAYLLLNGTDNAETDHAAPYIWVKFVLAINTIII